MSLALLSTKFRIPHAHANAFSRSRLIEKLLAGVQRPGSFVLLSSRFWKTTLLSEFATDFQGPLAWISLDESDNDPRRFWTYLLTACQSIRCSTEICPVVYFSSDGEQVFTVEEVRERVYQNEPKAEELFICYCFRHAWASCAALRMKVGLRLWIILYGDKRWAMCL
jgi:hypothetical protein